jgi:hypothetical protein
LRALDANRTDLERGAARFHEDVVARYTAKSYIDRMDELVERLLRPVITDVPPAPSA